MMTLDGAIAHSKEMAKKLRNMTSIIDGKPYDECIACAEDHEQLASWLEELKRYKSRKVLIKVNPQDAKTLKRIIQAPQFGIAYPDTQYEVVPVVSGGQADSWIPVSEKLPEDETDVLVCNAKGDMIVCRGSRSTEIEGEFIWYVCDWRYGNVTHWKPLPKAPESEDEV